jgi:hypothetical protein
VPMKRSSKFLVDRLKLKQKRADGNRIHGGGAEWGHPRTPP